MSDLAHQRERILRAVIYLEEHLDAEASVQDLARVAHFSARHFQRVFHQVVGEPVKKYRRRLRIQRAATWLRYSELPIGLMAQASGFETHVGFDRAFRAAYGMSPAEFRAQADILPFLRFNWPGTSWEALPSRASTPRPLCHLSVGLVELPPLRVVFLRHLGSYLAVRETWIQLARWAERNGIPRAKRRPIGINHDAEVVASQCRYDAGLIVDAGVDPGTEVGVQTIPGGTYATTEYRGSILGLYETWKTFVFEWLATSGFQPAHERFFDLHPVNMLTSSCLETALGLDGRVRSTLCVPVQKAPIRLPIRP